MSRPAERGKANAAGSEAEPRPVTVSRRFEAQLHCQPVVKVWRCTETGEAPRGQGATTENIGPYLREEQRSPAPGPPTRQPRWGGGGCIARRMQPDFYHGLPVKLRLKPPRHRDWGGAPLHCRQRWPCPAPRGETSPKAGGNTCFIRHDVGLWRCLAPWHCVSRSPSLWCASRDRRSSARRGAVRRLLRRRQEPLRQST